MLCHVDECYTDGTLNYRQKIIQYYLVVKRSSAEGKINCGQNMENLLEFDRGN